MVEKDLVLIMEFIYEINFKSRDFYLVRLRSLSATGVFYNKPNLVC